MTVPEILAIGLPTLSVLVGILLNRSDTNRLDARISSEIATLRSAMTDDLNLLRSTLTADVSSLRSTMAGNVGLLRADIAEIREDLKLIRNDQREFYRTLGQHEIRLDNLEKK